MSFTRTVNNVNFKLANNVNNVNIAVTAMTGKPYHHGNLAQTLVELARALIESEGAEALTVRMLAERAGVSAPALYRHFADKDALLRAVAASGFSALNDAFAQAARGRPPREALTALGLAYVDFALGHPNLHALMFGASSRDRPADGADRAFSTLVEATAACAPPGTPKENIHAAAIALWSLVHGYATLRRDGQLSGTLAGALPDPARILSSLMVQT